MLFNSLDFAIFFPVVFVLYWLVSNSLRWRNILVLVSSYVFYGWWDWRFLFLIAISSIVDFYVGQKLYEENNAKKRKRLLIISLMVNLGFLVYFKYTNFFIDTFVDSFRLFGKELEITSLNIILPVGISFYTFQTLSYTDSVIGKTFNNALQVKKQDSFEKYFYNKNTKDSVISNGKLLGNLETLNKEKFTDIKIVDQKDKVFVLEGWMAFKDKQSTFKEEKLLVLSRDSTFIYFSSPSQISFKERKDVTKYYKKKDKLYNFSGFIVAIKT